MNDASSRSGWNRWLRALALALVVGGCVALLRANDAEASAISDAGGDAGLWGVGVIFAAALLIPGTVLALVSLATSPLSSRSAGIAVAAGLALLAPTAWLAVTLYPPDKRTDEGLPLAAAQWDQAAHAYLLAFVLLGAAGLLLVVSAIRGADRAGQSPVSQERDPAPIDR